MEHSVSREELLPRGQSAQERAVEPDRLLAAGAGGDERGRSPDVSLEEGDVSARRFREVALLGDAGRLAFPSGEDFIDGLDALYVLGERRHVLQIRPVQSITDADRELGNIVQDVELG